MKYYTLNEKNEIVMCRNTRFNGSLETEKNIVRGVDGKLYFEEDLKNKQYVDILNHNNYIIELNNLKKWFETEYTKNEQKYRRFNTLQMVCEDGISPTNKLIDLYNEAETKRKRIQELEVLINE